MFYLDLLSYEHIQQILLYLDIQEINKLNKLIKYVSNILTSKYFWIEKLIKNGLSEYTPFFPITKRINFSRNKNVSDYNIIIKNAYKIENSIIFVNPTIVYCRYYIKYDINVNELINDIDLFKDIVTDISNKKYLNLIIYYDNGYCYEIKTNIYSKLIRRGKLTDKEYKLFYILCVFKKY